MPRKKRLVPNKYTPYTQYPYYGFHGYYPYFLGYCGGIVNHNTQQNTNNNDIVIDLDSQISNSDMSYDSMYIGDFGGFDGGGFDG